LQSDLQNVINQITIFMNISLKKSLVLPVLLFVMSCNAPGGNENSVIVINTTLGDIKIKLYDGTPIHRDNIIKLINSGFYDGVSFHRVIKDFMIQTGDPETKSGKKVNLPDSMKTYTIPAEFNNQYFHKKGAVAAARQGNETNPEMRSSGTQFYIVQGVKFNDSDLTTAELRINSNIKQGLFNKLIKETADSIRLSGNTIPDGQVQEIASVKMFEYLTTHPDYKISEDQRNVYKSIGGTPRLDGAYTVFGEVIEGLDVVDKIAAVTTDSGDKPVTDVKILKIKIQK
jgi:cyclophilin family peptidyl-prolyl cis-trans isomerase